MRWVLNRGVCCMRRKEIEVKLGEVLYEEEEERLRC